MSARLDSIEKWRGQIPDEELASYHKGSFGGRIGFGERPALVIVNAAAAAAAAPEAAEAIGRLAARCRSAGLPVFHIVPDDRGHPMRLGAWAWKPAAQVSAAPADAPEPCRPAAGDVVVLANKPSGFFGTPLGAFLNAAGADTLLLCGANTSDAIRATATDAFSHNIRVIIPPEACADRSPTAARASLFDLDMKMADVEPLAWVLAEIEARCGPAGR